MKELKSEKIQEMTEKLRKETIQSIDANQTLTDDELLELIQERVLEAAKVNYLDRKSVV